MIRPILCFLLLSAVTGLAESTVPASPFQRPKPASAAAPSAPANPTFEFNGVVTIGTSKLICITKLAEKRSHWIKMGESTEGITVLRFDADSKSVTIRHEGQDISLSLKQPTYDPNALASYQPVIPTAPTPAGGVALNVPVTKEQKEAEARYLVSDLLEIGMVQRKAYQEAQAREQAAKAAAANGEPPVPPPQH
jgi:hypothetical protein